MTHIYSGLIFIQINAIMDRVLGLCTINKKTEYYVVFKMIQHLLYICHLSAVWKMYQVDILRIGYISFICVQAAIWMVQSAFPSVRLFVTPFWLCSHHCIIMKYSGVITTEKSDVHAIGQGQRSKVKVTEVKKQLSGFRIVTPVWIHIWWYDTQSLWCLGEVSYWFSMSSVKFQGHTALKHRFDPD